MRGRLYCGVFVSEATTEAADASAARADFSFFSRFCFRCSSSSSCFSRTLFFAVCSCFFFCSSGTMNSITSMPFFFSGGTPLVAVVGVIIPTADGDFSALLFLFLSTASFSSSLGGSGVDCFRATFSSTTFLTSTSFFFAHVAAGFFCFSADAPGVFFVAPFFFFALLSSSTNATTLSITRFLSLARVFSSLVNVLKHVTFFVLKTFASNSVSLLPLAPVFVNFIVATLVSNTLSSNDFFFGGCTK